MSPAKHKWDSVDYLIGCIGLGVVIAATGLALALIIWASS